MTDDCSSIQHSDQTMQNSVINKCLEVAAVRSAENFVHQAKPGCEKRLQVVHSCSSSAGEAKRNNATNAESRDYHRKLSHPVKGKILCSNGQYYLQHQQSYNAHSTTIVLTPLRKATMVVTPVSQNSVGSLSLQKEIFPGPSVTTTTAATDVAAVATSVVTAAVTSEDCDNIFSSGVACDSTREEITAIATDQLTDICAESTISTTPLKVTSDKQAQKKQRSRLVKRALRSDPNYRSRESAKSKLRMQQKRLDPKYREEEREKDRIRRAKSRKTNETLRTKEKQRDRTYQNEKNTKSH